VSNTDKDTIVVADFTNTTGDAVFDETLRQGLSVQLEQSPFLSIVPDQRPSFSGKILRARASTHGIATNTMESIDYGYGSGAVFRSRAGHKTAIRFVR